MRVLRNYVEERGAAENNSRLLEGEAQFTGLTHSL